MSEFSSSRRHAGHHDVEVRRQVGRDERHPAADRTGRPGLLQLIAGEDVRHHRARISVGHEQVDQLGRGVDLEVRLRTVERRFQRLDGRSNLVHPRALDVGVLLVGVVTAGADDAEQRGRSNHQRPSPPHGVTPP